MLTAIDDTLRSVAGFIARSPATCWRGLTDAASLPAWLPGLRRARVIEARPDGLAREVLFDFGSSLSYSLVYDYVPERREVTWEPRVGRRDAVRGFARIEPWDGGSRLTYALEPVDAGRGAAGEPRELVAAFARWIEARAPLTLH